MRSAIALLLGLWLLGCGGDDDVAPELEAGDAGADAASDAGGGATGCGADVTRCDIRESECQHTINQAVACFREADAGMPPVRLISPEDYIAELAMSSTNEDVLLALRIERWYRGLALFGLAPADSTPEDRAATESELTAAFYSPVRDDIAIIDRGATLDSADMVVTLAHELVHAQQDRERDLEAWKAQWTVTDDLAIAASSVLEGEAALYHLMVAGALRGDDPDEIDWDAVFGDYQAMTYSDADEDAFPYLTFAGRFYYAFGGDFVARTWLEQGRDGIDALFDAPPRSTRAVLFGASVAEEDAMSALHAVAVPSPSPGYFPVSYNVLGAWMVRAFLVRAGLDGDAALAAAESIGADVFSVQVIPSDETLLSVWRLQLIEGASADWLDQLELGDVTATLDGSIVTLAAGEEDAIAALASARWSAITVEP